MQEFDRVGSFKSRRSWPKHLKYCPVCMAEDYSMYGETYWRRQHQLYEMFYCVRHQVRLVDSSIGIKRTTTGFYPASVFADVEYDASATDNFLPHKEKMLKIGQEIEWLIKHGLDIDWPTNGYEKYRQLLRDKGLASVQGYCDYPTLNVAFNDYWGKDFLAVLINPDDDDICFKGFAHQLSKDKMYHYRSLHHVLLMCFVAGSVSGFIQSDPAETPYGHPPFKCENWICPRYHIDGAEMVSLYYTGNGVTAVFECAHCGMRYKHNKAKHSRELRVIVDYGHLWNGELFRCCHDPKMTNTQITEKLKYSMPVLMLQKKKQGLLEPALYDTEIGPERYYKSRVDELCEKYDEVTIALLQERCRARIPTWATIARIGSKAVLYTKTSGSTAWNMRNN
jgi:hypothetical protein